MQCFFTHNGQQGLTDVALLSSVEVSRCQYDILLAHFKLACYLCMWCVIHFWRLTCLILQILPASDENGPKSEAEYP